MYKRITRNLRHSHTFADSHYIYMAKTKEQKKEILNNLTDKIKRARAIIFTQFNGFEVKDNQELRQELKKENSEYYVAKKTLLDLALKDAKIDGLKAENFNGNLALVFAYGDEVTPAKVVDKYVQKLEDKINFAGGILENKFISPEEISALAKLPGQLELYAKIVGSLNAPVSGLVNVLAGNMRNLVYVLQAIPKTRNV